MRASLLALGLCVGAPTLAQAETLEDAVAAAYANNPALSDARLAVRAAREDTTQASASYWPRVDVTADYGVRHLEAVERGIFGGSSTREEDLGGRNVSLRGVSELYTAGRREAQEDIARASLTGAQEGLRGVEQEVILRAVTAYADVLRDQEIVLIREGFTQSLAQDLHGAQRRLSVGDVTRTDVAQSQARLARAQAGEVVARAELQGSLAIYEAVVGQQPFALAPLPPRPGVAVTLDEAIEAARRIHPDLQQSRQEEAAARARIDVERAGLEPQIGLVGSLNFGEDHPEEGDETRSAALAARIAVPLFEGGFGRSRIRQSRINAERSVQRTNARERQILALVVGAWYDLDAAQRVLEAARVQVEADQAALDGVRREQRVGQRSTLDVLNAQQELLDLRLQLVRAERDAYVNVFQLFSSAGVLELETVGLERDTGR